MSYVVVLQHHGCETLGAIGDALRRARIGWRYYALGEAASPDPELDEADALVVLGGPFSVYLAERYPFLQREIKLIQGALERGIPILGICLGSQLIAAALGARVYAAERPEIGWLPVELEPSARDDRLFHDLPPSFVTCVWHRDVFDLPANAVSLARSQLTRYQAFRYGTNVYGLLFHLEMQPPMVAACVSAFDSRLREHGIDPAQCVIEANSHLERVAPIADTVFSRWVEMVAARRAKST